MKVATKHLACFLLFIVCKTTFAQDLPLYNQFILNGMLLNPSVVGRYNESIFKLTDRHQWIGIEGAPQTDAFTAQFPLDKVSGLGFCAFTDRYGALANNGAQISFAHHLVFKKRENKILSFGFSANIGQIEIQKDKVTFWDTNDPLIDAASGAKYYLDATFGAMYTSRNFFIGFSAANFTRQLLTNTDPALKTITANLFLFSGFTYSLTQEIDIEPSFLLKADQQKRIQLDANLRAYFDQEIWLGLSVKTSKTAQVMLGYLWKNLSFAYLFEMQYGGLYKYSYGTHELMLGLSFSKKGAVPCPAYH